MTNLGGHDMAALVEAFDGAAGRRADPVHRLYDQGLRPALRRPQGQSCRADEPGARPPRCARRWGSRRARNGSPGPGSAATRGRRSRRWSSAAGSRATSASGRGMSPTSRRSPAPAGEEQSTQAAFGRILLDLAARRRRARRPHRHHLARRHRLDQSRRLGEPARPVPPAGFAGRVRRRKDPVGAEMGRRRRASISSWASPRTICS